MATFSSSENIPGKFVVDGDTPRKYLRREVTPSKLIRVERTPNKFIRDELTPSTFLRNEPTPGKFMAHPVHHKHTYSRNNKRKLQTVMNNINTIGRKRMKPAEDLDWIPNIGAISDCDSAHEDAFSDDGGHIKLNTRRRKNRNRMYSNMNFSFSSTFRRIKSGRKTREVFTRSSRNLCRNCGARTADPRMLTKSISTCLLVCPKCRLYEQHSGKLPLPLPKKQRLTNKKSIQRKPVDMSNFRIVKDSKINIFPQEKLDVKSIMETYFNR